MPKQVRIYVVGPSSTGKTTLCNALAKRLGLKGSQLVTEVARQVITALGLGRKDIGLLEMQKAIMLAHLMRERENKNEAIQLCDRSAVDPIVYAVLTAANSTDAEARKQALVGLAEFQRVLPEYRASLFLLLTPVKEWMIDDGFRHVGDQTEVLAIFRQMLSELQIPYREIGWEMQFLGERIEFVKSLS
ncbi:AAA domain-containing protein [Mycena galericulata]|nr:AAA domain-containing protein [Mycena galericulata]